jgi:hypothetical protein
MKTVLSGLLYRVMRAYIGAELFARVNVLVRIYMNESDMSGPAKRAAVINAMRAELERVTEYAIAAAIELILLKNRG